MVSEYTTNIFNINTLAKIMGRFPDIRGVVETWLVSTGWTVPAESIILLIFVSLIVSTISGLVNRGIIDIKKLNENTQEIQAHQRRKKKAMETGDKKLWISVKRKEDRFMQLQRSSMTTRMIPTLITFGPIIFVFTTLRRAFQHDPNLLLNLNSKLNGGTCSVSCGVVAVLPFRVSHSIPLLGQWFSPYVFDASLSVAGFGFWYFLSAVVVSSLLHRLLGINLTGMQSPLQASSQRG